MAAKTNAQLQAEIRKLKAETKKIDEYKKQVKEAVENCNDRYNLGLCNEGLADFYEQVGIEFKEERVYSAVININNIMLKVDSIAHTYDKPEQMSDFLTDIDNAIKPVAAKWATVGHVIETVLDWDVY